MVIHFRVMLAGITPDSSNPNISSASVQVVNSTTFTYNIGGSHADTSYDVTGATATRVLLWDETTFTGALGNGWAYTNANGGWEYAAFLSAATVTQALLGDGAFALRWRRTHSVRSDRVQAAAT